jgi:serine/threonine protein kinase
MTAPDPEVLEEQFARMLEAYGEALAGGRTPDPMSDPAVPEALRSRLQDAVAGLQLLKAAWPPTQPAVRDTAGGEEVPTGSTAADPTASAGKRFRILRPHARGGLGEVFVARDEELHREVALKEMQERHAASPQMRARFLVEAEITGGLEHPGIVPVYGLGQYADGRPFYAMRLIRGESLKDAIEKFHKDEALERAPGKKAVAFRELLGRFVAVCQAIAYAHSRGVVHRDVKPSNVMLGKYGETLVVDWGLAKTIGRKEEEKTEEETLRPALTSDSGKTLPGSAVGTPAFMSPEQAAGRLERVGPASDVYSLGATLYCLLTGQSPFAQTEVGEVLQKVERGDFPPPRQVRRMVPAALEAICLKSMALRPGDRYASPSALADDVEHWLAGEPVSAWREPWWVRAARWRARHRPLVYASVAAIVVAVVLLSGATFLLSAANKVAIDNARWAKEQAEKARRSLYISDMNLAHTAWHEARIVRVLDLLNRQQPQGEETDLRGFEWHYLWRLCHSDLHTLKGHSGSISTIVYSPDGQRLASAGRERTVKLWDATEGREIPTRMVHPAPVSLLAFSVKGQHLASVSEDGTVNLWDATTGQKTATLTGHGGSVTSIAFRPDGACLASAGSGRTVWVWDTKTGR